MYYVLAVIYDSEILYSVVRSLTFRVISSEHDASRLPVGSHLIALTSFWRQKKHILIFISLVDWSCRKQWEEQTVLTVCPWNVLMGRSWPSLHTWMHMSVLQEANVLLLCQSTSRAGAEVRGRKGHSIRAFSPQNSQLLTKSVYIISVNLNETGTAVWLPLCEHPK